MTVVEDTLSKAAEEGQLFFKSTVYLNLTLINITHLHSSATNKLTISQSTGAWTGDSAGEHPIGKRFLNKQCITRNIDQLMYQCIYN